MKFIMAVCCTAAAIKIQRQYPQDLHGMPLLEFVMTHDENIEDVHFNYYPNEKEHWNFAKYPTQQLDGVAEANLEQA